MHKTQTFMNASMYTNVHILYKKTNKNITLSCTHTHTHTHTHLQNYGNLLFSKLDNENQMRYYKLNCALQMKFKKCAIFRDETQKVSIVKPTRNNDDHLNLSDIY